MTPPRTTAIVVAYRARDIIEHAMASARRCHDAGLLDCVVVDNASGDGTVEYLRSQHRWARIVENSGNFGFGRACNAGLRFVHTPYVLFLNPDAELEPPDLRTLVEFLDRHRRAGAVGPAIVNSDGGLQVTGSLPTPYSALASMFGFARHRPILTGSEPFRTEWLCGAVLLFRRELLDRLGGMDPRFFLYFEETDLCRRALNEGWELWAVGRAVAHHRHGAIARETQQDMYDGCIARHYFESRFYYLVKHFGWVRAALSEIAELAALGLKALAGGRDQNGRARLKVRLRAPILRLPPKVTERP